MNLQYKGYIGRVEIDGERGVLWGKVINTRDTITFEGDTLGEVRQAFQESVDDYLEFCKEKGVEPDKPFSGSLPLRLTPELHRLVYTEASRAGKSMNAWITELIEHAVKDAAHQPPQPAGKKKGSRSRKKSEEVPS
jgi:predicted HicB family RNase H-like nuclease